MAIISDYDEGENNSPAKPSPSSSASKVSFTGNLDRSNPISFIEKVFDFIASESDYLGKDSAEKEIASILGAAKQKKKLKEKAKEEAATPPPPAKKEDKAVPEVSMKDEEKEEDKSGLRGMLSALDMNLHFFCLKLVKRIRMW